MKTTEQPEDPQPVDEKELLTAWKDPHKDLSDPQLHDLAALIQNEVGSKQPPEIDLLQKMRRCRIVERRYGCSALNAWLKWAQDHVEALYGHEDRWLSAPMLFDLTIPSRLRQCVDESMARRALSGEDLVQGFVEGEIWL
ncbi:hypothetical protein P3342_009764 [Pyrenophora teres f. teres]|nr:hypothetical protein P3342_009764 [Pyrenophora teres f. teres]